jgi:type IV pilus assembly protein PilV
MNKVDMKIMKNKQRGSFVLEALIAILLFAIGILAIVGLQAASIGNTAAAKYRTDASLLANQVIAQMWVADKTPQILSANFCGGNAPPPTSSCIRVSCATAGANYSTWAASSVAQALPGVSVASGTNMPSISIDACPAPGAPAVYYWVATVTVNWQAPKDIASHNYSTVATIND